MTAVVEQLRALAGAEGVAVVLAVAYLLLMIRQSIWCWLCAILSSGTYVALFLDVKLYMEAVLYAFYVAMAVYGWYCWRSGRQGEAELPVVRWPWKRHAVALVCVAALSAGAGRALSFTDAAFPYIDSATTFAALWTTFLVARKVLENWWYWLVIDLASAAIYWQRDLELTSLLYLVYVVMIPFGLREWTRSYRQQHAVSPA